MDTNELLLAFETGIGAGSISLQLNGEEIDCWYSEERRLKTDEFLPITEDILLRNGFNRRDIAALAASNGPGSFTGIRNGLAMCLGLSKSLNCNFKSISIFDAMLELSKGDGVFTMVIPFGRDMFCRQTYVRNVDGRDQVLRAAKVLSLKCLIEESAASKDSKIIAHPLAASKLIQIEAINIEVENAGYNLAELVGKSSRLKNKNASDNTEVCYPIFQIKN